MNSLEALKKLRGLGPALTTNDAGACLRVPPKQASVILGRLARAGHIVRLDRGRWAFEDRLHPFGLPEALTAPTPSYVSLHSALYHHGVIEQIPQIVYAVTLGPTKRVRTPIASVSLHRVAPHFFFGFETEPRSRAKVAVPEKAIVDLFYLRPGRSRLFRSLPELELPRGFSFARARKMARTIRSVSRRAFVLQALEELLPK